MTKPATGAVHSWMIWPMGANRWTLTSCPELAKHAKKQGWSVIEMREKPEKAK